MAKLKINMVSESVFTVQGHGVHTAFVENFNSLKKRRDTDIQSNTDRVADLLHVHTVGPYSIKKLLKFKGTKVISAHVTPDSFVGSLALAKYWYGLAKVYLRWFYNLADGVLAVSNEVVDELKKLGVKSKIFLVPNTIDTNQYANSASKKSSARKKLRYKNSDFIIICNGQVQPRKRIDTFINAAKALPDYKFVWVGGIPFKGLAADYEKMKKLMENHPKNLKFSGVIPHEKVIKYYLAADMFFLPSNQETFGIVIVEAAAAGLPVLMRDIEQYKITFGDWYSKGNEKDFVRIIKRFATDKKFYTKWQKASKNIAIKYDSKIGSDRLMEVYRESIYNRARKNG